MSLENLVRFTYESLVHFLKHSLLEILCIIQFYNLHDLHGITKF